MHLSLMRFGLYSDCVLLESATEQWEAERALYKRKSMKLSLPLFFLGGLFGICHFLVRHTLIQQTQHRANFCSNSFVWAAFWILEAFLTYMHCSSVLICATLASLSIITCAVCCLHVCDCVCVTHWMNGGISDMYRLQDFHHPEAPPLESSKPKAFCFCWRPQPYKQRQVRG